jgi:uncharacterized membrane protein HdeD (DUF308 family)
MHGSSPAAWTAVIMALVGILIGGVALIPDPNWILFTIGAVLAVLAGIVGWAMAAAGFGVDRAADHH